jgi:hypothetical protein
LFTTTVAVAVSQFDGLHSILLMDWLRIIGMVLYVPLGVLAATVTIPFINAQWSCR